MQPYLTDVTLFLLLLTELSSNDPNKEFLRVLYLKKLQYDCTKLFIVYQTEPG